MIPLMMILTIDGPLHRIHGEMVSNAIHQGASRVVVVAQGPDAPSVVAMRLPGVEVTAKAPLEGIYYRLTIRERIVSALLLPERAFVALAIGMLFIFAEFCFPGTVLPGALGGVIVMTALYGMAASNLRMSGILLLWAAVGLFAASAFRPWHALLGFCAALAMCIGAILLVDAPPAFRIRPLIAIGITIPFTLVTLFLTGMALRARANKLPEQNTAVVFSYADDIFSTMSAESSEHDKNADAARRT